MLLANALRFCRHAHAFRTRARFLHPTTTLPAAAPLLSPRTARAGRILYSCRHGYGRTMAEHHPSPRPQTFAVRQWAGSDVERSTFLHSIFVTMACHASGGGQRLEDLTVVAGAAPLPLLSAAITFLQSSQHLRKEDGRDISTPQRRAWQKPALATYFLLLFIRHGNLPAAAGRAG